MTLAVREWSDSSSWNNFITSMPWPHFQQSWEWGELGPELGFSTIRLAAVRDGTIAGATQILVNRLSPGGSSYFYVPRGPAVGNPSVEILGPLFEAARQLGLADKAIGIKIEPNAESSDESWLWSLKALGFYASYPPNQPRSSWLLDISGDSDHLLAQMKSKTRYNIRLAEKKGVEVRKASREEIDDFYRLYQETAQRDRFYIHDKRVYERTFELFGRGENFCMLFACYQGRLIAAITLIRFGQVCTYLHGASSSEDRNLMAPYLLQWEGIQWGQLSGCTIYDFRAVPDTLREDQDMYGLYRFKSGFGGHQRTTMNQYSDPYRSIPYGLWQLYSNKRFQAANRIRERRGLPVRQSV